MKRELNHNLSGNEVSFTACFLLAMLKNLCSKLHRQKGFDSIIFSHKKRGTVHNFNRVFI